MKRTVSFIAALDIAFVGLLVMSSMTSGIASDILYYSAFILPILFGIAVIRLKGAPNTPPSATKGEVLGLSLPLAFPVIALISLIAFLTGLLLNFLGYENAVSFSEPFLPAALLHALVPALLEEMLFRFIPIKLLQKESASPAFSIPFTAIAFSLAHTNLFQIPYAAFAGAALALLFMLTGSIVPSVAVHFLNNLISLLTIYYDFDLWVYISVAVLAVASVIIVVLRRNIYKTRLKELFSRKSDFVFPLSIAVYTVLCISMSILNLKVK